MFHPWSGFEQGCAFSGRCSAGAVRRRYVGEDVITVREALYQLLLVKFVHAADLHLDSPMRGLAAYPGAPLEAVRGATRQAFESLIELCIAERVSLLVIAGDVYDGDWKDFSTGLYLRSQLARLREADIEVVIIHGNHDAASVITRNLKLPGIHVLDD